MDSRSFSARSLGIRTLAVGLVAATTALLTPATTHAAPGDYSYAFGQFLGGNLLALLDTDTLAEVEGERAESFGALPEGPETGELELSLVAGLLDISLGDGLGTLPIETGAGVVGQFAHARADGSSRAAAGLVTDAGVIGTPDEDAPSGEMTLSLGDILGQLALEDVADYVLDAELTLNDVAATIEQDGDADPVGDYHVGELTLTVDSPVLRDVGAGVNDVVDGLLGPGGVVLGLQTSLNTALGSVLGPISALGLAGASVTVDASSLVTAVDELSDGIVVGDGFTADIYSGTITLDLAALAEGDINDLDPNSPLLTGAVLSSVTADLTTAISDLLLEVQNSLLAGIYGIGVEGSVTLLAIPVIDIDTTVGALTDGDPGNNGITLLGGVLAVPPLSLLLGVVAAVNTVLASVTGILTGPAIGGLDDAVVGLQSQLLAPLLTSLLDDTVGNGVGLGDVLAALVQVTVNVQDSGTDENGDGGSPDPFEDEDDEDDVNGVNGQRATQRALRLELLPGTLDVLTIELANATVGANADGADVLISSPASGPEAGGTVVTISGDDLAAVTGVTFGGAAGTNLEYDEDTGSITITTPAHAPGTVDVVITNAAGSTTLEDAFTFLAAPVVDSIEPEEGPTAGGTVVTITGDELADVTEVTFDGIPATDLSYDEVAGTLTVTTPPHAAGAVDVALTGPGGTTTVTDGFTYVAAPAITGVDPDAGPTTGGQTVTITGDNLADVTTVTFDGTPATGLTHNGDGTITVTTPAHTTGTVDVVVTSPGGTATLTDGYTYVAAPAITGIDPDAGPTTGGQTVTITGDNLADVTTVTFDGTPATDLTYDPDTDTLTVTTPAHTTGTVDVVVTSPGGTATLTDGYTYVAAPTITGIDPDFGPAAGGTEVTISGDNLADVTEVTFDGTPATDLTYDPVTDTLTVTTPAHTAGVVDVIVTSPGGSATLPDAFTYLATPVGTALTPDVGPTSGGTVVTITGTDLSQVSLVTFDGEEGTDLDYDPVTGTLTVTTPAHTAGVVDVVLTNPVGTYTFTDGYRYIAAPVGTGLAPNVGPTTGGTTVTITGTNLADVTQVTFGGTPATGLTHNGDGTITVTTPAHTAGPVNVVLTGPGGTYTFTNGYRYIAAPVGTGLAPNVGPTTGGTTVTITGTNLADVTQVTFDGTPATGLTHNGDGTITITTPAHTAGPVNVVLTGPGGTYTFTNGYRYIAGGIDDIGPDRGPEDGGDPDDDDTWVTINGECFGTDASAVTVLFGDAEAEIVSISDGRIVVVPPAGSPGAVDVSVLGTACGDFTVTDGYTYDANPPSALVADPASGLETGGTVVVITGEDLDTATGVSVDGTEYAPADDPTDPQPGEYVVEDDGSITLVTLPHAPDEVDIVVTNDGGSASVAYTYVADFPEGPPPPDAAKFVPVTPCRLLDTRDGSGAKPTHDTTRTVQVGGRCEVPADLIAASLTVTVTEAEGPGFVTVWPDGERPTASNVNFQAGETRANGAVVRVSEDGSIELYTLTDAHLVVDVSGYWVRSSTTTDGRFIGDDVTRLLDTRDEGLTAFGPGETRTIPLPAGVPADAIAIAINLTLPDSLGPTFMTAWEAGGTRPEASAVNADGPGQFRAASLIVPVTADGFQLYSLLGGHAVVDYTGYFTGASAENRALGLFVPQAPERVVDTREDGGPIAGDTSIDVDTLIPGSSVIINLTLVDTTGPNFLTVWPSGSDRPLASAVNAVWEPAVANLAIVGQTDQMISIYSLVDAQAVVDVAGYFFS